MEEKMVKKYKRYCKTTDYDDGCADCPDYWICSDNLCFQEETEVSSLSSP